MIIHLTTVHPRDDSRIRSKQLDSLARTFGKVSLYVQDGRGNQVDPKLGYQIVDTGPRLSRLLRMSVGGWRMFRAVWKAKPKVAHFHDPELLPWAILLRLRKIKVVYDVHEDYSQTVRYNHRLYVFLRAILPVAVQIAEWIGSRSVNAIVSATPSISERFPKAKTVLVRNFPLTQELNVSNVAYCSKPLEVCYVGTITLNRNVIGMVDAINNVSKEAVFRLAGDFSSAATQNEVEARPGWRRVRYVGRVGREGVVDVLASARAGLVVIKAIPHEMVSLPIKLFEYMAASIPVISSDFPVWREILEGANCGIFVDPDDTDEIAKAIQWVLDNPEKAAGMGRNGREAVLTKYNWDNEAGTLISLYNTLLSGDSQRS